MCNLYRVTTNQEAIRAITRSFDRLGNLEPSLDIYPDQMAPIVRNNNGERELISVRWGMPSSKQALFQAATKRADKLRAKGKDVVLIDDVLSTGGTLLATMEVLEEAGANVLFAVVCGKTVYDCQLKPYGRQEIELLNEIHECEGE